MDAPSLHNLLRGSSNSIDGAGHNHQQGVGGADASVHVDARVLAAAAVADGAGIMLGARSLRHLAPEHARPRGAARSRSAHGYCVSEGGGQGIEVGEEEHAA